MEQADLRKASEQIGAFSDVCRRMMATDRASLTIRQQSQYDRLMAQDWTHFEALEEIRNHPRTAGWPRGYEVIR